MQGIKAKGYRFDFVCVHYYSASYEAPKAAAAELGDFLSRVHELYGKPVWLTEFALANWKTAATSKQQRTYIKEAVPMLENCRSLNDMPGLPCGDSKETIMPSRILILLTTPVN